LIFANAKNTTPINQNTHINVMAVAVLIANFSQNDEVGAVKCSCAYTQNSGASFLATGTVSSREFRLIIEEDHAAAEEGDTGTHHTGSKPTVGIIF
jgi:hypothetical protein